MNIGETKSYKTSNSITASNYTVKGNGTTGGNLTLYAGRVITFNAGFTVEKGGFLTAEPKYDIGDIKIYPMSSCSSSLKNSNFTGKDNTISQSKNEDDFMLETVSVYPNPTTGIINVFSTDLIIESISIYNQNGQLIVSKYNVPGNIQLDI